MSPITASIVEIVQWTLYDQQEVPLGTSVDQPIHFFRDPWAIEFREGEHGKQRYYVSPFLRTNLFDQPIGTKLGQTFMLSRVNALFLRNDLPLPIWESQLYARTVIEFTINQKVYWEGPAWMCASPFALFGTPREELPRLKERYGIEWEKIGATFQTHDPPEDYDFVSIGTAQIFGVRATVERNDDPSVVLAVHLDGPLARPIQ